MIKVILDTDIADDIDDAFALDFILKNPQHFELLGVITVFKNVLERARIAKRLIELSNKNVPVFMGINKPLESSISYFPYEQNNHLLSYKSSLDSEKVESKDGVDFIIETIKKYPNEIVLIGIGPCTDIAEAIRRDAKSMKLVKQIVSMLGTNDFSGRYAKEWNVMVDPEACSILLKSNLPVRFIPHEITCQSTLTSEELRDLLFKDNPPAKYINEMMVEWMAVNKRMPVLHDVLPIYSLIDDKCFKFNKVAVEVPLDTNRRGSLKIVLDELSNKEVATSFNRKTFMDYFMKTY